MASKTRNTTNGSKSADVNGADLLKDNVEKAVKGYDTWTNFSREAMEAWMQSTRAATKGFEALNTEALAFSKQSVEDTVSAAKAAMGAKTVEELYSLHTDFAKTSMDAYWEQMSKMGDMMTDTVRETWEPITGRYQAMIDQSQNG